MSWMLSGAEVEVFNGKTWGFEKDIAELLKWQDWEFTAPLFDAPPHHATGAAIAGYRGFPSETFERKKQIDVLESRENLIDFIDDIWLDDFNQSHAAQTWIGFWELVSPKSEDSNDTYYIFFHQLKKFADQHGPKNVRCIIWFNR